MKQIRKGVFETNSSSTHSITICTDEDYQEFIKGNLMYDKFDEVLVPFSKEDLDSKQYRYSDFKHLGNVIDDIRLETYKHEFVTPSGDKMVAFGTYGYDG